MHVDFLCPVCRDAMLELNAPSYMGRSRYYVTCPSCGVCLDHHDFDSYNGTLAFLRDHDAGEPEVDSVFNSAYDDAHAWVCSGCGKRRTLVTNAPPFRFCPDCGKPVE